MLAHISTTTLVARVDASDCRPQLQRGCFAAGVAGAAGENAERLLAYVLLSARWQSFPYERYRTNTKPGRSLLAAASAPRDAHCSYPRPPESKDGHGR